LFQIVSSFPDIYLSQGSVAMQKKCGGIFNDCYIIHLLRSLMVKEFKKSVHVWQNYGQE